MIFKRTKLDLANITDSNNSGDNAEEPYQYVQLKINSFELNQKLNMLIQIIDQTNLILFANLQEDNKFLGLVNATVSHELRNPLNAIIQ